MVDRIPGPDQDIRDWLTLDRIPSVGPLTIAKLIEAFGSPGKILEANAHSIRVRSGVSERLSISISRFKPELSEIEKDLLTLERLQARIVTRWDDGYPENLKDIYDPPAFLFVRGSLYRRTHRQSLWLELEIQLDTVTN